MFCTSMQNGLDTKIEKSRKQLKERKNRSKKICGVKKVREALKSLVDDTMPFVIVIVSYKLSMISFLN